MPQTAPSCICLHTSGLSRKLASSWQYDTSYVWTNVERDRLVQNSLGHSRAPTRLSGHFTSMLHLSCYTHTRIGFSNSLCIHLLVDLRVGPRCERALGCLRTHGVRHSSQNCPHVVRNVSCTCHIPTTIAFKTCISRGGPWDW